MVIRKILGVSIVYPSSLHPEFGTFVPALHEAIRKKGVVVDVLAPFSWPRRIVDLVVRRTWDNKVATGYRLYEPGYWSFSTRIMPHSNMPERFTMNQLRKSVTKCFSIGLNGYDFVYCYFLNAAWACLPICEKYNIPCVVEIGEPDLETNIKKWFPHNFENTLRRFAGAIPVSKENEAICLSYCPDMASRVKYLPNSVDLSLFKPIDRLKARELLGIPQEQKLAVFCGHFVERKGPLRVLRALESIDGLQGAFIGTGAQLPTGPSVLHAGPVENSQVPLWLSAGDVFVLPSLGEGMSVAIIEALACGLPVVVSDRPFNRNFLTTQCASFVDPYDIRSIADAIHDILADEAKRDSMSKASLSASKEFSLDRRAEHVLTFCNAIFEMQIPR